MGVRVGIAELVGDAVEEEVAALGVHVHGQVLERGPCEGRVG